MKCPVCGGAELVSGVKFIPYTYKGRTVTIKSHGDVCPACGEIILPLEECDRMDALLSEFNRKINAELFDPAFILSVRQKLNLDQRQAGDLFGGGVNAFSRYERGKTVPPTSLVQLFRLLDAQPELLEMLRTPSFSVLPPESRV